MDAFATQPREAVMERPNKKDWSSVETNSESWKELFTAALLEFDNAKLAERISAARAAIVKRMESWQRGNQGDASEANALQDALHSLRHLEKIAVRK